ARRLETRGPPRVPRGGPSVGGVGGPCRGPPFADVDRHRPHEALRRLHRAERRLLRSEGGRDPRPHRPERLGQDHPLQLRVGRALEILGLVGLATTPHAPTTLLGAGGLKKLELARALATGPRLLLADESLGGLDSSEMAGAADLLRRIRGELHITIVWVEHIM